MMTMRVTTLWKIILISLLLDQVLAKRTDPVSGCLLKKHFYHTESGSCLSPLDSDVCQSGEWLLPSPDIPGELRCCPVEPLTEDCTPALLPGRGKVVCEEKILAERYGRGQCGDEQLVLPDNFQENTLPCPLGFSCTTTRNSSLYQRTLNTLQRGGSLYKHERKYLKDLVCDYQSHSLCLPDQETDSLFTKETLLASLMSPLDRCQPNPCPEGRRPWLAEDGYYRCLLASPQSSNCPPDSLIELDGELHCELLGLKSVAPSSRRRCPRRQVWSIYRNECIIIYG